MRDSSQTDGRTSGMAGPELVPIHSQTVELYGPPTCPNERPPRKGALRRRYLRGGVGGNVLGERLAGLIRDGRRNDPRGVLGIGRARVLLAQVCAENLRGDAQFGCEFLRGVGFCGLGHSVISPLSRMACVVHTHTVHDPQPRVNCHLPIGSDRLLSDRGPRHTQAKPEVVPDSSQKTGSARLVPRHSQKARHGTSRPLTCLLATLWTRREDGWDVSSTPRTGAERVEGVECEKDEDHGHGIPFRSGSPDGRPARGKNVCVRVVHAHTHSLRAIRARRKMFATCTRDFRVDIPRRVFRVDRACVMFTQIRAQRFRVDVAFVRQCFRVHVISPPSCVRCHCAYHTRRAREFCNVCVNRTHASANIENPNHVTRRSLNAAMIERGNRLHHQPPPADVRRRNHVRLHIARNEVRRTRQGCQIGCRVTVEGRAA